MLSFHESIVGLPISYLVNQKYFNYILQLLASICLKCRISVHQEEIRKLSNRLVFGLECTLVSFSLDKPGSYTASCQVLRDTACKSWKIRLASSNSSLEKIQVISYWR